MNFTLPVSITQANTPRLHQSAACPYGCRPITSGAETNNLPENGGSFTGAGVLIIRRMETKCKINNCLYLYDYHHHIDAHYSIHKKKTYLH